MSKKKSKKISPDSPDLNPCPKCQLPLHFIKIPGETHLMPCEKNSWEGAKECPNDIKCFSSDFHHYWDFTHFVLAKHRGLNLNTSKNSEADDENKESPRKKPTGSPRAKKVKSPGKKKTTTTKETASKTKRKHKVLLESDSDDDFISLPRNSQLSSQYESVPQISKRKKSHQGLAESDCSDTDMLFVNTQSSPTLPNTSTTQEAPQVDNRQDENNYEHFLFSSSQDMFTNYPDPLETKPNCEELQTNAENENALHPYQWDVQTVEDEMAKKQLTPTKRETYKEDDISPRKSDCDYPTPTKYLTQEFKEITGQCPEDYFKKEVIHTENTNSLKKYQTSSQSPCLQETPQCLQFSDSDDDYEFNSETGEILFTTKFEEDKQSSTERVRQVQDDPLIIEDSKKVSKHVESIEAWKKILKNKQNNNKTKVSITKKETNYEPVDIRHTSTDRAPFYKLIPDTDFVVDGFKNGPVVNKNNYFLSHFHYDHYIGLNKHFSRTIHCSTVTGELLKTIIRIDAKYIRNIDVGETKVINQVEVTALDANHCPGALMFVFKTLHGQSYLHTGDFRADLSMQNLDILRNNCFENVYLDTTYCNPSYTFPSQQVVLDRLVRMIEEHHSKYPKTLYICGSYTIGKEKVYISILKKMKWKIYVESYKRRILTILNDETINAHLVDNAFQAKLHVIAMSKLNNIHHLLSYYESYKSKYDKVVAIKPTGWTYSERNDSNINVKKIDENICVYEISYSEHSSFLELCKFVKFLRFKQIVCTVNVRNSEKQVKMIDDCIKKKLGSQVTNTLNSYFTHEKF